MDIAKIRAAVLATLEAAAPGVDLARIDPLQPLHPQIDLDSMDWINVIVGLHERLDIDIPESDYGRLATLDAIVDYLGSRLSNRS